jgi:hypothetical protein
MLLGQDGGGDEHGHLYAVHHRLEGGSQSDLGFPIADVAADQTIHRPGTLHVLLDFLDGAQLVIGFDVGEGAFQFALPRRIGRKSPPLRGFPPRVQSQHVAGDIQRGAPGAFARGRPFLRAQA